MSNELLKFPNGEFTHTELAKFNNKTNQQVWTRYQQAIKDGVIVSAGTRPSAGKGKPSKLWKLATGQPVPVVTPTLAAPSPAAPVTTPVATPAPVEVVPTEAVIVPAAQPTPPPAPVVEAPKQPEPVIAEPVAAEPAKLPEVAPAVAPAAPSTSPIEGSTVEVVRVEPTPAAEVNPPVVNNTVKDVRTLTETCPICGHPLVAVDDATGVMVWCNQPKEICPSAENPFGHGDTDRKAYDILLDKWTRKTGGVPA